MADKKTKIAGLFSNNKFTFGFSFILAFIIWISVAMVFSPETQRVIEDVPVKINMENSVPEKFDLQLFGQTEFTVDVTITGKRYVVGSKNVNADSIEVVAQTGYVDSAGKKQLLLKASLVDTTADYEIESLSDEYIEAYFDEYKEAKFPLQIKIDYDGEYIPEGYIQGENLITLNSETVTEVEISGAARQVNSIKNVYAHVEIKKPLTETQVMDAEIIPTDEFGMSLKYIKINGEENPKATVTIPVLKTQELITDIDFSGVPSAYSINSPAVSISPYTVKVGMPESILEDTQVLTLREIDFSSLGAKKNVFVITKEELENTNLKILDETEEFRITVDFSHMSQKNLLIKTADINLLNNKSTKDLTFDSEYIDVTLVGPEDALNNITAENLLAEINLDNVLINDGVNSVIVKVSLKNSTNCWVYGNYNTTVLAK